MRVLAVCESPPTVDPREANGSTLISHHVLHRLPDDLELDLVWFRDRHARPSDEVLARCRSVEALGLAGQRAALVAAPSTRLPLATWRRTTSVAAATVAEQAAEADVVYLHGLHTFGLLPSIGDAPLVAHEIDPWSHYWSERAGGHRGPSAWYDRLQARRAARLERVVARRAHTYIVVNSDDAGRLAAEVGREITDIPNGVDRAGAPEPGAAAADVEREPLRCVFPGTLDYAPNVAAAERLVREVWPQVVAQVPAARLVIAGRRPTAEVLSLRSDTVDVLGDVDDLGRVMRSAGIAIFAGDLGRGTKNTVAEAMANGCAMVVTTGSARGLARSDHLHVADDPADLARHAVALLGDVDAQRAAGEAAAAAARAQPSWDDTAERYVAVLREAAATGAGP